MFCELKRRPESNLYDFTLLFDSLRATFARITLIVYLWLVDRGIPPCVISVLMKKMCELYGIHSCLFRCIKRY